MKITLPNNYRDILTVNEADQAKALIKRLKADYDINAEIRSAAYSMVKHTIEAIRRNNEPGNPQVVGFIRDIIAIEEAEVQKNLRLGSYDYHGTDTGLMDLRITALAETTHGLIRVSGMLSDIWQFSAGYDIEADRFNDGIVDTFWIRYYEPHDIDLF